MKGLDKFCWWFGEVEDRDDPLQIGRCRVRILGYHTDNKQKIPTNTLPWAYPMMPVNTSQKSVPAGLEVGTWVLGFFKDGQNAQQPVILGATNYGYVSDDEVNTHQLARNYNVDTTKFYQIRRENLDSFDIDGEIITEPTLEEYSEYPLNKVEESESGHLSEVDDTPGYERLTKMHKSGTIEEIIPDGTKVTKVVGDNYNIILKDNNIHIHGNCNIYVEGDSVQSSNHLTLLQEKLNLASSEPDDSVVLATKLKEVLGDLIDWCDNHTHSVPKHDHPIPDHDHTFTIPAHSHTVGSHSHGFTGSSHSHGTTTADGYVTSVGSSSSGGSVGTKSAYSSGNSTQWYSTTDEKEELKTEIEPEVTLTTIETLDLTKEKNDDEIYFSEKVKISSNEDV
jgi:hypothetical protein